jgi:hypothetical protein
MEALVSLIAELLDRDPHLSVASKYSIANGVFYLAAGGVFALWPGSVQTLFKDRAFVGDEQSLFRVIGMTVAVIGWLYLFGGRSGRRQFVAASVIDRITLVPAVLVPLVVFGIFPHSLGAFAIIDPALGLGAWVLSRREHLATA